MYKQRTMATLLTVPVLMMVAKYIAHALLAIHLMGHLIK